MTECQEPLPDFTWLKQREKLGSVPFALRGLRTEEALARRRIRRRLADE